VSAVICSASLLWSPKDTATSALKLRQKLDMQRVSKWTLSVAPDVADALLPAILPWMIVLGGPLYLYICIYVCVLHYFAPAICALQDAVCCKA